MRRIAFAVAVLLATTLNAQTTKESRLVLDAAEKHIVRAAYHADEAVTLSGRAAGGWHLYAGAAIDAQRIDLRMRNVRGEVRFRADWTRVKEILDRVERASTAKRLQ